MKRNLRGKLIVAGALVALAGAAASVWAAPDLHLRGGRFRPLAYGELDPAQKAVADAALATGRTSFDGPFNITLRSPEMATLARAALAPTCAPSRPRSRNGSRRSPSC